MRTRCLGGFSVLWLTKLLISPVKNWIFCPRTSKFGPKLAFLPDLPGSFGALLVGWLVVVARGPYLARHLFTLFESSLSFRILSSLKGRTFDRPDSPVPQYTTSSLHKGNLNWPVRVSTTLVQQHVLGVVFDRAPAMLPLVLEG